MTELRASIRAGWSLIKSLQTSLLLVTGLAGYMSARCPFTTWQTLAGVAGSLFLAVGGSTVLNMVYDRDIDAMMGRTCRRPLPAGTISVRDAKILGLVMSFLGVAWAFALSALYGAVVLAGVLFDTVVYTAWLKRRSAWSILWGGIAGGMPVLAGRALGLGVIDPVGLLLAAAVVCWIPTHIMTFSIRYQQDYQKAGVPTFPARYGVTTTRRIITLSSAGVAVTMGLAALLLGLDHRYLGILGILAAGLIAMAAVAMFRPSERLNFGLFKYASVYMLMSMLLVAAGA